VLAFWVICVGDRLEKLWVRRMIGKTKYESVAAVDGEGGETQEMGGVRRRGTNAYGYPSH
jgi:hypothetical protein